MSPLSRDVEPEITAKVAALGARVYEVGISYAGRTYDEGKKIGWHDGVRALWCIVKYRPRRCRSAEVVSKRCFRNPRAR